MRRFILLIILSGLSLAGFAQYEDKYSSSTQMFLSVLRGETQQPQAGKPRVDFSLIQQPPFGRDEWGKLGKLSARTIAQAEDVDGQQMISAFIHFSDNDFTGVKALGVKVQNEFNKMVIALIPVDKIEDVAALDNVTNIEVAEVLKPATDQSRSVTKAIDAITNSSAAQALGITSPYTGKGVVLGVIDSGIDFTHIAFKDKNGSNRIKIAWKLRNSTSTTLTAYTSTSQINGLTYDTNYGDHGTHTVSTAGGSSVIVNGNTVTVTDDHANATYGGMAPEADLAIAGLSSLYTTSIGSAIQNICNYADQQGKPCVISLSLGSQIGPHDGTGSIADIVNQYAGNNHIIVYAASNDAMRADMFVKAGTSNGGGMYASGTSTSSKPMLANVQRSFTDADGNVEMLYPTIYACARTANVATTLKFHVVNVNTGAIVYSSSAYTNSTTIDLTGTDGLAAYFKSSTSYSNMSSYQDAGKIRITRGTTNGKYYWEIYCPIMISTSYNDNDGDEVYNSDYAFCVSVYPSSNNSSTIIDMWENNYSWFGRDLTLSSSTSNSYNLVKGSDDCSVSDNACYSKVISVGAYVTKNHITNYEGTTTDYTEDYPNIGDHAYFSSYQTAGCGPLGTALPTINAPGARIVAAVNHYHTASLDQEGSYYGDYKADLVVNSTSSPYGAMEGTSMATPCVSGIIAQWLQACVEKGKTITPDYIKEVMAATWDTDEWTAGTGSGAHGANTFGTHGKINAIKGLQYILGVTDGPTLTANPTTVTFTGVKGQTYTQTINVSGSRLKGNVTATLSGANVFTIDKNSISKATAEAGTTITVTYAPTAAGTHTATLTLSSSEAEDVVISISATAEVPTLMVDPETLTFDPTEAGSSSTKSFDVAGFKLTGNVTLAVSGEGFSVSPATLTAAQAMEGATITVTFAPAAIQSYSGTITLSSQDAESVAVTLSGEGTKAYPESFDVTVSSYGISTLYLDYPVIIPYDTYDDLLGVYYVYDLTSSEARMARIRNIIPANEGVVVQGNSGKYTFQRYKGADVPQLTRTNYLSGSVENITPAEALAAAQASSDAIIMTIGMGSKDKNNGYIGFYSYTGNTLYANKAFLIYEPNGSNSANALSIGGMGLGDFTAITEIDNAEARGTWHTLQGAKLNGRPTQKGIYIHNGKAVVVK